jgi:hypothetical protein
MPKLHIVIPTLGREGLVATLRFFEDWRKYQPKELQNYEIYIFHNANSSGSKQLTDEMTRLITNLECIFSTGEEPLEGAELSFREALRLIDSGYVLPVTDDNKLTNEGFEFALKLAEKSDYEWVHFNSITNGHPNYLIENILYETAAEELVSRIGINFSLCCISRSLFRIESIDFNFWDKLISNKQSVFSWSVVLAHSFSAKRVALTSIPIEIRTIHEYDSSMERWHQQWYQHAKSNSDIFLFPFTVHLGHLHQSLLNSGVIKIENLSKMVVMEGNQLRPLSVEMTNLLFIHLRKLDKNEITPKELNDHINLLRTFFPQLGKIYSKLNSHLNDKNFYSNPNFLRKIEMEYRELIGFDNFLQNRLFGNSPTNLIKHPLGWLQIENLAEQDWRAGFMIFTDRRAIAPGMLLVDDDMNQLSLVYKIESDPFYELTRIEASNVRVLNVSRFIPGFALEWMRNHFPENLKNYLKSSITIKKPRQK